MRHMPGSIPRVLDLPAFRKPVGDIQAISVFPEGISKRLEQIRAPGSDQAMETQ